MILNKVKENRTCRITEFKLENQPDVYIRRLAKQKKYKEAAEFAIAVRKNPLKFFCPNVAQEKLLKTIFESTKDTNLPVILSTFANGVGKSTLIVQLIINIANGKAYNGWFNHQFVLDWKYPKNIWYAAPLAQLENTVSKLLYSLTKDRKEWIQLKKSHTYFSYFENVETGFVIELISYEKATENLEGPTLGLIVMDEPARKQIWNTFKSRRRMGCVTIMIMTPLYVEPYILEEIRRGEERQKEDERKIYFYLKASVFDAQAFDEKEWELYERLTPQERLERGLINKRGHLTKMNVADLVASYDADEREARAYGEFMYFSTRIYSEYKTNLHYRDPEDFPIDKAIAIIQATDPHESRPAATVYMAIVPVNKEKNEYRRIIFDEYPIDKSAQFWDMKKPISKKEEVKAFIKIEINNNLVGVKKKRIIDKRFGFQKRGETSIAEIMEAEAKELCSKIGIPNDFFFEDSYSVPGKDSEIKTGHAVVKKSLELLSDGEPGFIILKKCIHSHIGMLNYIRRNQVSANDESKHYAEMPIVEKYKNIPDAIRYASCAYIVFEDNNAEKYKNLKPKYDPFAGLAIGF